MKPFHRKRISWLYFSFKWLEINSSYMGNNLKSIFFLILPAGRRQVTKISQMKDFCSCSVRKMLFFIFYFCPYCNYALCSNYALSLLMTTSIYHRIFFFFFFTALHTQVCFVSFFFFFFKSSKYVTWTISVKIYQYACRSSALLLLFFFHCDAVRPNLTLTFFFSLSLSIRKGQTHFCKFPETSSDAAIVFFFCFYFVDFHFVCLCFYFYFFLSQSFCQTCVRIRG